MQLGVAEVEAIRRFCQESQADLYFIREYEKAIKWLGWLRKKASADAAAASNFVDSINNNEIPIDIDSDGEICKGLESACRGISSWIDWLREQHQRAEKNERLDDLASELDETIDRLFDLRPAFEEMIRVIQKHDHDLNTTTGTYNSIREMFAALNAK
jgi:hypothetical protein